MAEGARISVVIPTTGRHTLAAAVESALRQTYPPVEVIVVFDAARIPDGVELPPGVRALVTGSPQGANVARQHGIEAASGDAIALLDDDDYWFEGKLEAQASLLEAARRSGRRAVVSAGVQLIDQDGSPLDVVPRRLIAEHQTVADYLFKRQSVRAGEATMGSSTLLIERALALEVPFEPHLLVHEDWDWLLRAARDGGASFLMAPGPQLRLPLSLSSQGAVSQFEVAAERHLGQPLSRLSDPTRVRRSAVDGERRARRRLRRSAGRLADRIHGAAKRAPGAGCGDRCARRAAPSARDATPVRQDPCAAPRSLLPPETGADAVNIGIPGSRRRAGSGLDERLERQVSRVVADGLSLFGTTVVTSGAGFAFWWAAAQLFDRSAIGSASAAISAVQLLGIVGMLGLGTLLIGELSKGGPGGQSMLTTALMASALCGGTLGAIFVAVVDSASPGAQEVPGGMAGAAVFVAAVAATAALLVLDDATVGLARARWQLWRNVAFSLIKLALLPLTAVLLGLGGSAALVGSWLAGAMLSTILLRELSRRERETAPLLGRPRLALIRSHGRSALTHHWLNISSGVPRLLLPVLVAAFLSPAVNAGFYVALLLVGFAYVVPSQLATACFAIASGDRSSLAHVLRRVLRITVFVGVGTAVVFLVLGRPLLSIFGHGYSSTSSVLAILGTATIATGVKSIYISVCRVNGDLGRCAVVACLGSLFEVGMPLLALALHSSLEVVALCWVVAMWIEGMLVWPAVAAASGVRGGIPRRLVGLARWSAPRTLALGSGPVL